MVTGRGEVPVRVSVAMVSYNGEKYLKEQIESVLQQLGPEDELVVSDDGSTDRTLEILEKMWSMCCGTQGDPIFFWRIRMISGRRIRWIRCCGPFRKKMPWWSSMTPKYLRGKSRRGL